MWKAPISCCCDVLADGVNGSNISLIFMGDMRLHTCIAHTDWHLLATLTHGKWTVATVFVVNQSHNVEG